MTLLIHQRLRLAPSMLLLLSLTLHMALNVDGAVPLMFGLRKRVSQALDLTFDDDGRHRSTLTSFNPAGYVQLGEYFISMSLGTPAQTFDAVIDTGSGVIHVPCAVPPGTSPPVPTFNFSASTTLTQQYCSFNETKPNATECGAICDSSNHQLMTCTCTADSGQNECHYKLSYGDKSGADGFLFNDVVYFNDDNRTTARLELGCATNFTKGMFVPRSPYFAGIDWQEGSLLSQLTAAGITDDTFSMCLGDAGVTANWNETNTSSDPTAANGLLVLGTAPPLTSPVQHFFSTQAINYTAWNSDQPSRSIVPGLALELMSLAVGTVNDTSANLTSLLAPNTTYPALLDSGTAAARFPGLLAVSLVQSLEAAFSAAATTAGATVTSNVNSSAATLYVLVTFSTTKSPSQLDELLPPLVFQFSPSSPVTISLPPSRYLQLLAPLNWVFFALVGSADSEVVLGNEIIRYWYIQATKSTLQVNISIVDSCNNLTFLSTDMHPPSSSMPQPHSSAGSSSSKRAMHAHADAGAPGDPVPIPHDASQHHVRASLRRPHGYLP